MSLSTTLAENHFKPSVLHHKTNHKLTASEGKKVTLFYKFRELFVGAGEWLSSYAYCSSRGPVFNSQHLHGGLQQRVTPVLGDPLLAYRQPASGLPSNL